MKRTNDDIRNELVAAAEGLAHDDILRADLKISATALTDLRQALGAYRPYRHNRKVCVLGSARTLPGTPLFAVAQELGERLARRSWMVVTGAGPGIMQAAMQGAGVDDSFGVGIELPFEFLPNSVIAGDSKYVRMTHFFTRKLMLMKECAAFVALPGGFGTLDEIFEIITLIQTGKARPTPVIFLDAPGGTYWSSLKTWISEQVVATNMVTPGDDELFLVTDSIDIAVDEVEKFYRNYHSIRDTTDIAGNRIRILRMHRAPSIEQLIDINRQFGAVCETGTIDLCPPSPDEISDNDLLAFDRIGFVFNKRRVAVLRHLIDHLNTLT